MKIPILKNFLLSISFLTFIFSFSYWYPRFLVSFLGEKSSWISYLYTYGMGFIFFLLSVVWIFTRSEVDPMRKKSEIPWLIAICYGLVFMFLFHGLWIVIAETFPIKN